ncbi:cytochrome ubiquinol oxidase subunit II, partial [Thioclava sp. BHET1]
MKGHARPDAGAPTPGTRRLGRFLALGSLLLVSGCVAQGSSFMSPEGPIAALQKYHLIQVTIISLVVVLPVIILVPWLAWHYRASNKKATYRPEWDMNHALEWVMWGVPVLIVIVLGWYLWIYTHKLDPYKPIASTEKATQVQVVGLDWKWMFIYPDYHIATVGEMAFPEDRPVALSLTSDTVMQSFLISALGGQIYTMPGMDAKLHLSAHTTGSYLG